MSYREEVAQRLRLAREELGLSQAQVSRALELRQSFISSLERGKSVFTAEVLQKMASQLRISADYLITGNGPMVRRHDLSGQPDGIEQGSSRPGRGSTASVQILCRHCEATPYQGGMLVELSGLDITSLHSISQVYQLHLLQRMDPELIKQYLKEDNDE